MFRLFRSRALGRAVAALVLLCALVALQPANHAHAQPAANATGHHDGHGSHSGATLNDGCCHIVINGCSGTAFVPAAAPGMALVWHRVVAWSPSDAATVPGRITRPDHRPPRLSA